MLTGAGSLCLNEVSYERTQLLSCLHTEASLPQDTVPWPILSDVRVNTLAMDDVDLRGSGLVSHSVGFAARGLRIRTFLLMYAESKLTCGSYSDNDGAFRL